MATTKKFSKDEIQKMVLGGMMFAVLLYVFFQYLLTPLGKQEKTLVKKADEFREKIRAADLEIRKSKNLEAQAASATEMMTAIKASTPPGLPIAWYPVRLNSFFKRHGLNSPIVQMTGEAPAAGDLSSLLATGWSVTFDKSEFTKVGLAVAAMENESPMVQINDISIVASTDEPEFQKVVLTFEDYLPIVNKQKDQE